jgi:hypothetical protein
VLTVFRFCIETDNARAITPLSCVALSDMYMCMCAYASGVA